VGRELWVLDTRAGEEIRLVADIRPGADGSNLHNIVARGERIFFTANDGVHGVELWQSDGSPEGTTMMGDIYPGDLPSGPESLTVFGNRLIFSATDGSATGRELWAVDLDILPQTGWILNGGYQ
jgi:ELWxxDGT repeat protein